LYHQFGIDCREGKEDWGEKNKGEGGMRKKVGQLFRRREAERPNGGKRIPYMDVGLRPPEKEEERIDICLGAL
jgi:hypothetical protein